MKVYIPWGIAKGDTLSAAVRYRSAMSLLSGQIIQQSGFEQQGRDIVPSVLMDIFH